MDTLVNEKLTAIIEAWCATKLLPITWHSIESRAKLLCEAKDLFNDGLAYLNFVEEVLSVTPILHGALIQAALDRPKLEDSGMTPLQALIYLSGGKVHRRA